MRTKNLFFFLLFFVFLFHQVSFSQKKHDLRGIEQVEKIKILEKKMASDSEDTIHATNLNELSRLYNGYKKYDKALHLANQSLKLSNQLKYTQGIGSAYATLSDIYLGKNNDSIALVYANKADKILTKLDDKKELAYLYMYLGQIYQNYNRNEQAITVFDKGLTYSQELKINNRIGYYNDFLGTAYYKKGDYLKAIQYYEASLNNYKKEDIIHRIALCYGNIGLCYLQLGERKKAIDYYAIASKEYKKEDNIYGELWMNERIASIYKDINKFDAALEYIEKAYKLYPIIRPDYYEMTLLNIKSSILIAQGNYDVAREILNRCVDYPIDLSDSRAVDFKTKRLKETYFQFVSLAISTKRYSEANKYLDLIRTTYLEKPSIPVEKEDIMNYYRLRGTVLIDAGKINEGRALIESSLSYYKERNINHYLSTIYQTLSYADSVQGDYSSSLNNYKLYIHYLQTTQNEIFLTEKTAFQYEFEKKEAIAELELKNRSIQRNYALVGLVFALALIVILFRLFQLRNKTIKIEKKNIELEKRDILRIKKNEEFKSRFLTNITHEFRTPLTLIKGHLEILLQNESKDKNRYIEMQKNSNLLLRLINRLMELSRMESTQYKLKYQKGKLNQLIQSNLQSFHSLLQQRGIAFEVKDIIHEDSHLEEFGYAEEAVSTIISNLLSNAIKFTPKGGKITFIYKTESEFLEIQVTDTGIGISPEHQKSVFDRFYQVDTPQQQTYEGSGIGLALVKELAELHGGSAQVQSEENLGTTFTIRLKNQKTNIQSNEIFISSNDEVSNAIDDNISSKPKAPVVLVVEDQDDLRKFIIDSLGNEFEYLEADNGKDGLDIAQEKSPDLIISDVMMPQLNGLLMCEAIKTNVLTSHIPVILLTAKSEQEDLVKGLEMGADNYLVKPFSVTEIKLRVRNMFKSMEILRKKYANSNNVTEEESFKKLNKYDQAFIEKLELVVKANMSDNQFDVNVLAEEMFLSSSQLTRKMKGLIGETPANYIRAVRMRRAKKLLQEGETVTDTAWKVGFEDSAYFSKVFKKYYQETPSKI